jgi:hypothetical protein
VPGFIMRVKLRRRELRWGSRGVTGWAEGYCVITAGCTGFTAFQEPFLIGAFDLAASDQSHSVRRSCSLTFFVPREFSS